MRTVNASVVLRHAAALSGQPVNEDEGIDRNTQSMLTAALNGRLPIIWRADRWPDLIVTEQRRKSATPFARGAAYNPAAVIVWNNDDRAYLTVTAFVADADNEPDNTADCAPLPPPEDIDDVLDDSTYDAGDWVRNPLNGLTYYCREDGASGGQITDPTVFYPVPTDYFPDFELDNQFQTPMGDVLRVTDTDPDRNEWVDDLPYRLTRLGVRVHDDPGIVWMQFRAVCPEISGEPWDETSSYAVGAQVYYEASGVGNFFNVTVATSAGESPDTTPTSFEVVEIPAQFSVWLSLALAADWLRMDGATDKAGDREQSAAVELARLKDNLHRQQRQTGCLPVATR